MKQVNVTIRAENLDDIRHALEVVAFQIGQNVIQEWDKLDTGEYHFNLTELPPTDKRTTESLGKLYRPL